MRRELAHPYLGHMRVQDLNVNSSLLQVECNLFSDDHLALTFVPRTCCSLTVILPRELLFGHGASLSDRLEQRICSLHSLFFPSRNQSWTPL